MVDSRVLRLPSKLFILADRFACLSFLTIVGGFAKALIPLDARRESEEDERRGLDLVLTLTNPEETFR